MSKTPQDLLEIFNYERLKGDQAWKPKVMIATKIFNMLKDDSLFSWFDNIALKERWKVIDFDDYPRMNNEPDLWLLAFYNSIILGFLDKTKVEYSYENRESRLGGIFKNHSIMLDGSITKSGKRQGLDWPEKLEDKSIDNPGSTIPASGRLIDELFAKCLKVRDKLDCEEDQKPSDTDETDEYCFVCDGYGGVVEKCLRCGK